jgi:polyisoprenoid-binding protein YceI
MNRPLAVALATLFLAGSAGLALSQPARPAGGPPAAPPVVTDPAQVPAGHYTTDPRHGGFVLKVQHMGLDQSMFRFDKWNGTFDYDPAHLEASKVNFTVETGSFSHSDQAVADDFKKVMLDSANNPTATFVSTGLKRTGKNTGVLTGNLTLKGVTKPLALNVTFNGLRTGMGPARVGFTATGTIVRADYGVGAQMPTAMVGNVDLDVTMEFTKAG